MRRFLVACAAVWMSVVPALSQNPPSDSQTLRDILTEIRRLRQDLQTTSVASQRVQIALYRLQLQDAAVAKASRAADDAREKLNQTANERKRTAEIIEQWQNTLESGTVQENQRRQMQASMPGMKSRLEQLTKDEAQWQARVADADERREQEQSKFESLQTVLDELDRALQNVGRGGDGSSRR